MNKEELIKKFKSMSSRERKELILKKMEALGIEVGSGNPNKNMIVKRFMNQYILQNASLN